MLAIVALCQPFIYYLGSGAGVLAEIAAAMPAAYWLINDAKLRSAFVPHVLQPAIVMLWVFVVPLYLLTTRKWWGLLYLVAHVVCSVLVSTAGQLGSIHLIWPMVFPDIG